MSGPAQLPLQPRRADLECVRTGDRVLGVEDPGDATAQRGDAIHADGLGSVDDHSHDLPFSLAHDLEVVELDPFGRDVRFDHIPESIGYVAHLWFPSRVLVLCITKQGGPGPTSTVHLSWT